MRLFVGVLRRVMADAAWAHRTFVLFVVFTRLVLEGHT